MGYSLDPDKLCLFVYRADKSGQVFEPTDIILPMPRFAQAYELTTAGIFDWLRV